MSKKLISGIFVPIEMGRGTNDSCRKKEDLEKSGSAARKGKQEYRKCADNKTGKKTAENEPKMSPAEVWKNAAKIINTKKKENRKESKLENQKSGDFESLKKALEEWANKKKSALLAQGKEINEYNKSQIENSLRFYDDYFDSGGDCKKSSGPFELPDFFPQNQLCVFEFLEIYKKLDIDTLFYIFYTERNTLHQYFAVRVLKSRSWRFHTKYNTWFQRLEEPKYITEDYEQGSYMFFDYDTTWSIRKKSDFTFEYKYLENTEI